jgi:peptidyl-prolyl cis-trans isomerase D
MAVLETIRVKFGVVITVLIAVALLSFIIDPTTLQSVSSSMSSKYDAGEIDGKSISYVDYQTDVEKFTTINEIMTGASASTEEQQASIRNAAWQALVDKYLVIKNANKAGIFVGSEEMSDIVAGNINSPVFSQNPMFLDANGTFSPAAVSDFLSYKDTDQSGRLQLYWNYLLESAKTQEYYSKYLSLFTQSDFTNPLMLSELVAGNNNTFDVEFVMVPFGYAQDTTVVVSDSEIKAYYNAHKKFYRQNASRDIEYVVFEVVPSAEDIAEANQAIINVYDEFAATDNMKAFLLANFDRTIDNHWYKAGELNTVATAVNDYVFSDNASVSEVISNGNTFYVVRVMESAMVPEQVYVKYAPANSEDVAAALAEAEAQWIPQTPGYEDVMTAKKGTQVTANGLVFEVLDTKDAVPMKRVAILEKKAVASEKTKSGFYTQANTFASKAAGKYASFQKAIEEEGVYAHPVNKLAEGANRLGSIENTREVTRWAFEAKVGDVSNIITVDNNYFIVAALKGIHKEGFTPVEEVAARIRPVLYQEKAAAKKTAEVAEKINGLTDLAAVAEVLGTTVSSKEGVTFASFTSAGLDNKFIGAASVAEVGALNGPLQGNTGVYVYTVTDRSEGAFFTEDDAALREQQMSYTSIQMLLPVMMDEAKVKDNTARFY